MSNDHSIVSGANSAVSCVREIERGSVGNEEGGKLGNGTFEDSRVLQSQFSLQKSTVRDTWSFDLQYNKCIQVMG
jgi:hypothetical protein